MKLGTAIAEIMKREGIEILTGYPVNHLIEYAAIAGGISIVIVAGVKGIGTSVSGQFSAVGAAFK